MSGNSKGLYPNPRAIRFTKMLHAKIDKFCEDFHKKNGVQLSFSDAVRTLIERGLRAK